MAAFNKKILRAPRRTTQSSFANKYAPHNTSGLSEALDHSGPGVFHPLGKVRVVSLICRVHDFGHVPAFSHGKSSTIWRIAGTGDGFFSRAISPRTSKVWDLCGLALLLADAILLPLSLAWDWHQGTDEPGSFFLLVVFLLSLLFWSVDICMNLNTAFYQRGFLVFSRWEILKHYLQTWCLDSIGCADQ